MEEENCYEKDCRQECLQCKCNQSNTIIYDNCHNNVFSIAEINHRGVFNKYLKWNLL
jgi:hypothetical protein